MPLFKGLIARSGGWEIENRELLEQRKPSTLLVWLSRDKIAKAFEFFGYTFLYYIEH